MLTESQRLVANSSARFKVVAAGRRFGKSYLAMSEMAKHARHPNCKVWYETTTYGAAKNIMWYPLKRKLIDLHWSRNFHEVAMTAWLINGSEISLKGANNPDSLRGVGLDYNVMDEAAYIDQRVWTEVIRPTLSDRLGGGLFISSPEGRNWFWELYQYAKEGSDPDWEAWQFTTLEGGNVPPEEVESAKRSLDTRTFNQEYLAEFVTYTGLVYYGFSDKNVVDIPYNPELDVHIGMDFNIDPMTSTVFQFTEDGDAMVVVDELEIYGSNTDEMAEEILTRFPENMITVYPDPACVQSRTSAGGRTDLSILQKYGFKCKYRRKHPLIRDRVNAVNSRFCSADSDRRLLVNTKCKKLIRALERHSYKEGTSVPMKGGVNDFSHMTDSIGYLTEYLFPVDKSEIHLTKIIGV
jgi:hypothetical protein